MLAVVLAAGDGTRMAPFAPHCPKPLVPLAGRPLITYVLQTLAYAGVQQALIVVGHQGEAIEQTLGDGHAYGLLLSYAHSPHSGSGSGLSLYAAREATGGRPFLLLMGDHLVSAALVQQMVRSPPICNTLCVDRDARWVEADEATRVWVEPDGRIRHIGKGISPYNGVDTGMFWLTSAVFARIRAVQDALRRPPTLTETMRWLIERGPGLWARQVSGVGWMDVDTPQDLRRAHRWLQEHPLPPGEGVGGPDPLLGKPVTGIADG